MIYIAWFILGFTLLRWLIALINYFSPLYLKKTGQTHTDQLSVLIPARNEAHNLPRLLKEIRNQAYPELEVIVYNDQSEDDTAKVLDKVAQFMPQLKVLESKGLPAGWTGKNHACHQLAQHASGKYLLFLDADVKVKGNVFRNAVSRMKTSGLHLLSIFPQQEMKTPGEKMTVPLMNWILLSLLPLRLVEFSKRPSLAAANGQFMLFEAENYRHNLWHQKLRKSLVEDIEIIRMMKQNTYKVSTLLGNHDIVCRMYQNYQEGVNGFAKNVIQFFGNSNIMAILFLMIILFGFLSIVFLLNLKHLLLYLVLVLGIRMLISVKSNQPLLWNLILHPIQMITFAIILIKGFQVKRRKKYIWKGRQIEH